MGLRHLLEYDDSEIQDLLSDLEGIGMSEKMAFSLWVFLPYYQSLPFGPRVKATLSVAEDVEFWSGGNLERDSETIDVKIRSGSFESKIAVHAPVESRVKFPPLARREKKLVEFLTPESIREFFLTQTKGDLSKTLLQLQDRIDDILEGRSGSKVILSYDKKGSLDLLVPPDIRDPISFRAKAAVADLTTNKTLYLQ